MADGDAEPGNPSYVLVGHAGSRCAHDTALAQDFVAITEDGYRVVQVGEELEASDEVVNANPKLFKKRK